MFKLREKFITYKIKKENKRHQNKRQTINYDQAHHFGILFTIEDRYKHEEIKKFLSRLVFDGKQVQVLAFLGKDKDNHEFKFEFFTENDLSLFGEITNKNMTSFASKNFDYLFNLDLEPNIFIKSVLARSRAKCRVGYYYEKENPLLELMLKVPDSKNNISEFFNQVYFYTKNLIAHK